MSALSEITRVIKVRIIRRRKRFPVLRYICIDIILVRITRDYVIVHTNKQIAGIIVGRNVKTRVIS